MIAGIICNINPIRGSGWPCRNNINMQMHKQIPESCRALKDSRPWSQRALIDSRPWSQRALIDSHPWSRRALFPVSLSTGVLAASADMETRLVSLLPRRTWRRDWCPCCLGGHGDATGVLAASADMETRLVSLLPRRTWRRDPKLGVCEGPACVILHGSPEAKGRPDDQTEQQRRCVYVYVMYVCNVCRYVCM
jgi:hypothetical protein